MYTNIALSNTTTHGEQLLFFTWELHHCNIVSMGATSSTDNAKSWHISYTGHTDLQFKLYGINMVGTSRTHLLAELVLDEYLSIEKSQSQF